LGSCFLKWSVSRGGRRSTMIWPRRCFVAVKSSSDGVLDVDDGGRGAAVVRPCIVTEWRACDRVGVATV